MTATSTTPVIEGTSDDDFDLAARDARPRWKPVRLCLDGNLIREIEEVKERIAERANERAAQRAAAAAEKMLEGGDTRLATPGPVVEEDERDPEQDRLDELNERMRAKAVTMIVTALPPAEYNRLLEEHPPRIDAATGRPDLRDRRGYNSTTLPPVLIRASITRPTMTDERWAKVQKVLNDAQMERLLDAAVDVNRRDEDIPF